MVKIHFCIVHYEYRYVKIDIEIEFIPVQMAIYAKFKYNATYVSLSQGTFQAKKICKYGRIIVESAGFG